MVYVSVVIPVFNVEDFLEECLDCIVNQSLTDIEIIFVISNIKILLIVQTFFILIDIIH